MSEAFRQQWLRTSPAKRLLVMLTVLAKQRHTAKQEPLSFALDELESIQTGDGLVQSVEGNRLVLRYVPTDTQLFTVQESHAAERTSSPWQTNNETDIPSRLAETFGLREPINQSSVTTTDDAEMAAREARQQGRSQVQRTAAARRGVQLPLTQPTHPPS